MPYDNLGQEAGEDLFKFAMPELFEQGKANFGATNASGQTELTVDDSVKDELLVKWQNLMDTINNVPMVAETSVEESMDKQSSLRPEGSEPEDMQMPAVRKVFEKQFGDKVRLRVVAGQYSMVPFIADPQITRTMVKDMLKAITEWLRNGIDYQVK